MIYPWLERVLTKNASHKPIIIKSMNGTGIFRFNWATCGATNNATAVNKINKYVVFGFIFFTFLFFIEK